MDDARRKDLADGARRRIRRRHPTAIPDARAAQPRPARRSAPVASARPGGCAVAFVNFAKGVPLARYEHVQRQVTERTLSGDYKVYLEFNDGRKGVVDLSDELHGTR